MSAKVQLEWVKWQWNALFFFFDNRWRLSAVQKEPTFVSIGKNPFRPVETLQFYMLRLLSAQLEEEASNFVSSSIWRHFFNLVFPIFFLFLIDTFANTQKHRTHGNGGPKESLVLGGEKGKTNDWHFN